MLFNSLPFLILFLPIVWLGFQVFARLRPGAAALWLVGTSLAFYGWWNPAYLILLCASILFNYAAGAVILRLADRRGQQHIALTLGVAANLGLLCYYKYLFPLLHLADQFGLHLVAPDASVILPLGISFFTFTQIGYLIDCKAGITAGGRFLDYCLFVTFFPHLIAGPILHHREMMPQFASAETWRFDVRKMAVGLSIFFIGLAKKDLIADYFATSAIDGFSHAANLGLMAAWSTVLCYSVQLYFDFSGYSEMAVGLALMFNVRFPANFDSPYKSASIIDFWQRWHITLTRYLNLYLYNPIALWVTRRRAEKGRMVGRQGLKSTSGFLAMCAVPTLITMVLAGVWHGAGINYVIFGLLHAVYLIINHAWRLKKGKKHAAAAETGISRWVSVGWKVALTYLGVLIAQIFFRASSFAEAREILEGMVGLHSDGGVEIRAAKPLVLAFLLIWCAPNVLQIFEPWQPTLTKPSASVPAWMQWKPTLVWAVVIAVIALLAILGISGQSEFLYFQF